MPAFTVPTYARLREFNHCHNPEGTGGGRFCSTSGETSANAGGEGFLAPGGDIQIRQISPTMYRVMDRQRGQPIRWKGPRGMRDIFTKREAEKIAKVWAKRKQRDPESFYKTSNPGREEFEDLLGWMNGVVGG